ncbi:MAG TPA: IS66 family insertion sequence element accessory protein TnpB [Pseudobacteroides sp.]|uniref:IS66 family insertion sequence element accessory protein TnpB n=1 Tax=Pseudobacteroides sp. TaxID=1968840 RepID=UPI002F9204AA
MFVFCNRNHNLIKIIQWDGTGLWLLMKRLDKGDFRWPMTASDVTQVSIKELRWLHIEHKLSDEERICSECGKLLKVITKEKTSYLRFVPARVEREEH